MIPYQISAYVEFAYFLSVFLLSITVYFQARKMQVFAFHRGINYFGNAFLAFSLLYFFRFMVLNLSFASNLIPHATEVALEQFGMFLVTYFSFLAIFSLISSFLWKRYHFLTDNRTAVASLFISCATFFMKLPTILLLLGVAVAFFLALKAYDNYAKKRKIFSPIFVIYTLLVVFILFDLVPITQQVFQDFKIAVYIGSICVFLYINLKIKKVLSAGEAKEN